MCAMNATDTPVESNVTNDLSAKLRENNAVRVLLLLLSKDI